TPRFARDERVEEAVEGCLEHSLQASQDELASSRRVDDGAEMMGYQVFGERIPLDSCERCQCPDQPVRVRVQYLEQPSTQGLRMLFAGHRDPGCTQDGEASFTIVAGRRQIETTPHEAVVDR